jgi:hypothetical protein
MMEERKMPLMPDTTQEESGFIQSDALFTVERCCCCKIAQFHDAKMAICGHWKTSWQMPILIIVSACIVHGIFIWDTYATFPSKTWLIVAFSVSGFAFLSMVTAYFAMIVIGPGYVPYDWAKSRQKKYSWDYEMAHIAHTPDQIAFARTTPDRPPRSSFSVSARRFILRADHFCDWSQTWIGIKNHRFFMLSCFWAAVYGLSNIAFRYFAIKMIVKKRKFHWECIFGFATILVILLVICFCAYHFILSCKDLIWNLTSLERWAGRSASAFDNGMCSNCEEVCGTRKLIIFWIFPFFLCWKPLEDGFYNMEHVSFDLAWKMNLSEASMINNYD